MASGMVHADAALSHHFFKVAQAPANTPRDDVGRIMEAAEGFVIRDLG
jgi:hypothetical protein